ncbi:MAG: glycosyltransferase [Prevotellaceae bacterium]|jgi:glycosyltransferase involved in cell wall biosynthesis|nr:glycosyltransferase [Prevotellaceae bacterium]
MKIAYLSTFYPYRGGIAQFNASLLKAFERQAEVRAYTFTRQYPSLLFPGKTQYVTPDDNATPVDATRTLDTINPLSYHATAKKIAAFAPDVLVMKYWTSFLAPSLGYVAGYLKKQAKVIAILDNAIPHEQRFFDKVFTQYFLNRSSGFIVMSDAVKRDLLSLKPDAKLLYKPHPLYDHFGQAVPKAQARAALGLHPNKKTLLFFGLIRDYKGLDLLIEAFGKLPPEYQLLVAGEPYGSFEKYCTQIAALPNAQDVRTEARYISDAEVPLFFSAADACVLPYRSATQSGITSIACHFNLPMIATDVGGLKEATADGETGVIVAQPDAGEIEKGVIRFFEQGNAEKFRANIGAMKQNFTWESFAQAIVDFSQTLHSI